LFCTFSGFLKLPHRLGFCKNFFKEGIDLNAVEYYIKELDVGCEKVDLL
jgi:hypothetical protein